MQGWPLAKWQLLSTLNAYEQLMTSLVLCFLQQINAAQLVSLCCANNSCYLDVRAVSHLLSCVIYYAIYQQYCTVSL